MKKIMKKALSLMLALVMVFTLAPMTADAAVGDVSTVIASKTVTMENNYTSEVIEVTPEVFGELTINITSSEPDYDLYYNYSSVASGEGSGSYSMDVRKGKTYYFELYGLSGGTTITYNVTLKEKVAPAVGTEANPQMLTAATETVTIPANTTYYVECAPEKNGDYNLTISGADTFAIVEELPMWEGGGTQEVLPENGVYTSAFQYEKGFANALTLKNTSTTDSITLTVKQDRVVGTMNSPADLVMGANVANNPDYDVYYYTWTATEAGIVTIVPGSNNTDGWAFDGYTLPEGSWTQTYIGPEGGYTSGDDTVVEKFEVDVLAGDTLSLMVSTLPVEVMEDWFSPMAGTVNFTASFEPAVKPVVPGSTVATAIETSTGAQKVTLAEDQGIAYYSYTAKEAGLLSVQPAESSSYAGFTSVNDKEIDRELNDYTEVGGADKIELNANDKVIFFVTGAKGSEVSFNVGFEAGAVLEQDNESSNGGSSNDGSSNGGSSNGGSSNGGSYTDDVVYETSTTPLTEGEKTYTVSNIYPYTVFEFEPTETGVYTITTTDAKMGNLGAQVLTSLLNASVVKETSITIECKEVGPSWNIAVASDTNKATIKVAKAGEAEQGPGYDRYTAYVGVISPVAYTYEGEVKDLKPVNYKDDVVDKAVVGADSYYHLNSVDGPILYVDLDDKTVISLYDVFVNGGMKAAYYNENGKIESVVDYSSMFNYYYTDLADKETKLYPLTSDLMEMIQEVGNTEGKDWFDKTNQYGVKSDKEDAWMFCCYYNEDITTDEAPYVIPPVYVNDFVEDFKKPVVDKEAMATLVEYNKTQPVSVIAFTGNDDEIVTFTFAPTTLKLVDGVDKYDFSVEIVKDADKVENDKVTKDNFVLRINFAYSGQLPAEATITIPVPAAIAEKYEVLYYYQVMEDGSLKYVCDAPVEGGIATVKQDHCSDYVLLTEKIADDADDTEDAKEVAKAPKTGDSSNIVLWVAVLGLGVVAIAGSVVMKKREF